MAEWSGGSGSRDGGGEVWYDECGVNAGFSGEEGAV